MKNSIANIRKAFNEQNTWDDAANGNDYQQFVTKVREAWYYIQSLNIPVGTTKQSIYETLQIMLDNNLVIPGFYHVDLEELEALGWNIDNDDTANAMNISIEEANEYVNKTYHAEIHVAKDRTTSWRYLNTDKYLNGIDEGSDSEWTGDDQQTINDLNRLIREDKVWKLVSFV